MDFQELIRQIESRGNGIYTNSNQEDDRCPICHGSGWESVVSYTETGTKYDAVRPCTGCNGNHDKKAREKKALADIPDDRTLESFNWNIYIGHDLSKQKQTVTNFIEHFDDFESTPMGLYITSKTRGSGKTFLASCIGGELINRYETSIAFVNASDLLDISLRKKDELEDPIEKLISCRVLILDDLGQKNTGREWLSDILFRIFDKRCQKKRIMIVTSNIPLHDLDFDDRIVERLYDMSCLVKLPEFKVRSQEANKRRSALLKRLGIEDT